MPTASATRLLEADDRLQLGLVILGAGSSHQVAEGIDVGLRLPEARVGLRTLGLRQLEHRRQIEEEVRSEIGDLALRVREGRGVRELLAWGKRLSHGVRAVADDQLVSHLRDLDGLWRLRGVVDLKAGSATDLQRPDGALAAQLDQRLELAEQAAG